MGHCRFTNTLADLRECHQWLVEHEPTCDLSAAELKAYEQLVALCKAIAEDYV